MSLSAASPARGGLAKPAVLGAAASTPGKIGPNAILQVQSVLVATHGKAQMQTIMRQAGLGHYLVAAPSSMVDEREIVRLHQAVRIALPDDQALATLRQAGTQTAQYVLAHRIPKPVQTVLKRLPAHLASRVLLRSMAKNAWTFAGSGVFAYSLGSTPHITLTRCPACTEVYAPDEACAYYTATFEGLCAALVHPRSKVIDDLPACADGSVRTMRLSWS